MKTKVREGDGGQMGKNELDMVALKEVLLAHYKQREPHPFIQFDVVSDPRYFDDMVTPDSDGYSSSTVYTYELMYGSGVRILIDPETPKDKVIGSIKKVVGWIKKSKILEEQIDELKTGRNHHVQIEEYQKKQKNIEIEKHLIAVGYTESEIGAFAENKQTELNPF